jgi:hypothetical protein
VATRSRRAANRSDTSPHRGVKVCDVGHPMFPPTTGSPACQSLSTRGQSCQVFLTSRDRSSREIDRIIGMLRAMGGGSSGGSPGLVGPDEAVASGLADGASSSFVFVVGGDLADGGVQAQVVVVGPDAFEFGAKHLGVVDVLEMRPVGLDVPEALDGCLVGGVRSSSLRCGRSTLNPLSAQRPRRSRPRRRGPAQQRRIESEGGTASVLELNETRRTYTDQTDESPACAGSAEQPNASSRPTTSSRAPSRSSSS